MYLNNQELNEINGGSISATLLNAISRAVTTIYDIGYAIGSSIRRLVSGNVC